MAGICATARFCRRRRSSTGKQYSCQYTFYNPHGQVLQKVEYPELYAAIGDIYGTVPDKGKFMLPNYEGYFLRGVDTKGDVDKDKGGRTNPYDKKMAYTGVGSFQDFALQDHTHDLVQSSASPFPGKEPSDAYIQPSGSSTTQKITKTDPSIKYSENETRSVNLYVYWLIRSLP